MRLIVAIWDSLTLQNVQAVLPLFQGLSSLGVIVSIFIYIHQRRVTSKAEATQRASALEAETRQREAAAAAEERQRVAIRASEKQANRSRLTEAYMSWHHTILRNDKKTILSGKMMRRGHALVRDEHEEILEERAREVHLLCLLLNTLFLEWNYRSTYDEQRPDGFPELNATIDNLLTGLVVNSHQHYREMIDRFDKVFPDFPPDFIDLISYRIAIIRERHTAMLAARRSESSPAPPAPPS